MNQLTFFKYIISKEREAEKLVFSFKLDKDLIKVLTVINSVVLVPATIEMMPVLTVTLKMQ